MVRTQPSQGWYTGSTPVRAASYLLTIFPGNLSPKYAFKHDLTHSCISFDILFSDGDKSRQRIQSQQGLEGLLHAALLAGPEALERLADPEGLVRRHLLAPRVDPLALEGLLEC